MLAVGFSLFRKDKSWTRVLFGRFCLDIDFNFALWRLSTFTPYPFLERMFNHPFARVHDCTM